MTCQDVCKYLEYILTFYLTYILAFYLAFYLTYILTFYLAFNLTYILTLYPAFCRAHALAVYLTYILAFCPANMLAYFLGYIFAFCLAVEVHQCTLRSGAGGWGPALHTAIWPLRMRSSGAHCDPELAKRIDEKLGKEDWRIGLARQEGRRRRKSSSDKI